MNETKIGTKTHPTESELADFLGGGLSDKDKALMTDHIGSCAECLAKVASAHEAVSLFAGTSTKKGKELSMKHINFYLIGTIVTFILSFSFPKYFLQFLVATILLGMKWIIDSKSTKMLIMIHEAWKKGGEKETAKILRRF